VSPDAQYREARLLEAESLVAAEETRSRAGGQHAEMLAGRDGASKCAVPALAAGVTVQICRADIHCSPLGRGYHANCTMGDKFGGSDQVIFLSAGSRGTRSG
jgi:hypothetical protein